MCWLKREMWKTGIAIASVLLLLALMVGVPVSAASAYERTMGLATLVLATVSATPTEDATVTALNKEKLAQEVEQLKEQNALDLTSWLRANAAILLSTLVVVIGGLVGLFRWFGDRRDAQDKDLKAQAEERFKTAITALGDEKQGTQISGIILLRSFLNKDDEKIYERYYTQIFDLAVAYLRLPRSLLLPEDPDGLSSLSEQAYMPQPLSQMLIAVFKTAFPLARDRLKEQDPESEFRSESLDASRIQLDNALLFDADLRQAWMPWASLRNVYLGGADLSGTFLSWANLSGADLSGADLSGAALLTATLSGVNNRKVDENRVLIQRITGLSQVEFSKAKDLEDIVISLSQINLMWADLSGADLSGADLSGANLIKANLMWADLSGANLSGANLSGANLSGAVLNGTVLNGTVLNGAVLNEADLNEVDLSTANLGEAKICCKRDEQSHRIFEIFESTYGSVYVSEEANVSWEWDFLRPEAISAQISTIESISTDLRGVKGLTEKQLEGCKARGAIIDEDSMTSLSQPLVSPSPSSQSNDVQAQTTPPVQESTSTPDAGESSAAFSEPN